MRNCISTNYSNSTYPLNKWEQKLVSSIKYKELCAFRIKITRTENIYINSTLRYLIKQPTESWVLKRIQFETSQPLCFLFSKSRP